MNVTCRMNGGKSNTYKCLVGKPLEMSACWRVVEDRKLIGSINISDSGYHFERYELE